MDKLLVEAGQKIITDLFSPAVVRHIEQNNTAQENWNAFVKSGFLDILCSEEHGGAGHQLPHAHGLIWACGRQALPIALASSIWIRAVLTELNHATIPESEVSLALGHLDAEYISADICFARTAEWVVLIVQDQAYLLPKAEMQQIGDFIHGTTTARFHIRSTQLSNFEIHASYDWISMGASIFATLIAGAASRIQELCHVYADERKQFGKPIGSFQAIQHHLAILAEEVMAVRYAAEMTLTQPQLQPNARLAAIAKARCSQAVVQICSIGHLIHGAIGVTEEYDLQLYTRRLHEWRMQFGSESYWYKKVAADFMQKDQSILNFVVETLD